MYIFFNIVSAECFSLVKNQRPYPLVNTESNEIDNLIPYLEESIKEAETDNLKKLIEDYIDENQYEERRLKSFANKLNVNRLSKRSFKLQDLELCKNVHCNNIHSNGQVSKTWRMAQLQTCCPSYRKKYSQYKKNAAY